MRPRLRNLSRNAGEVEAQSAEGEGAASGTVPRSAVPLPARHRANTVPLVAPSPGALTRTDLFHSVVEVS